MCFVSPKLLLIVLANFRRKLGRGKLNNYDIMKGIE